MSTVAAMAPSITSNTAVIHTFAVIPISMSTAPTRSNCANGSQVDFVHGFPVPTSPTPTAAPTPAAASR